MLPKVILYNATSIDGRITGFNADIELYYNIASKLDIDAVLMGSNTVLAGFEAKSGETREENLESIKNREKDPEDTRPYLIIPDSKGRIRIWNELFKLPYLRDVIVLCSKTTPEEYLGFLKEKRIEYIIEGEDQVNLKMALDKLNLKYGIKSLRVDSGGILNGALLREGLANEFHVLIHPELVGGTKPDSIFNEPNADSFDGVINLELKEIEKLNNGIVWLRYKII